MTRFVLVVGAYIRLSAVKDGQGNVPLAVAFFFISGLVQPPSGSSPSPQLATNRSPTSSAKQHPQDFHDCRKVVFSAID